jgi:cellulose synthase (UDP-forming)
VGLAADVPRALPAAGRHRSGSGTGEPPAPPSDAERDSYGDRGLGLIVASSVVSFGALLLSQAKFLAVSGALLFLVPLIAFTIAYYLISLAVNLGTRGFDLAAHHDLARRFSPACWPSLDVFLPVCGERAEVLRNTWAHAAELARRYPGPAVVHVLDDGNSAEAARMAAGFGFTYVVRANRGWFKKAGNLRHAFERSAGEFILILDADFAPRADMPAHMLPYFYADPKLGIVQSPQYFRTRARQSWIERGAGAVQELFYRLVQVSRDRHDGAICVGSCAIYRRAALAAIGGTALIEHSEDVHTGFDLRRAGWGLRYIPVPLATGLCPPDPDSFLAQQYRWCAGSMSLLGSRKFWTAAMGWRTRCCYLSGFCYYAHTAAYTFATPLIPLVMLTALPERVKLANYAFIIPSIAYNFAVFPAWHRCRFGPSAFMAKMLYGWAHVFALWDICRGRRMGWQPTGAGKKSKTRRIWVALAGWNGTTSALWLGLAIYRTAQYRSFSFAVVLGTGAFACLVTGMALRSARNYARCAGEAEAP